MNSAARPGPNDAGDPNDPGPRERDAVAPLPATADQERHAGKPEEDDQSIAGEEDPGAALDGAQDDSSKP